jgi:hypothetical protein
MVSLLLPSDFTAYDAATPPGRGCDPRGWEVAMSGRRLRSPGYVLLAIVCAAVVGVTSIMTAAFVFGVKKVIAEAKLLENDFIMGGTSVPDPSAAPGYIPGVEQLYLNEGTPIAVNTPEEFCPPVCFPAPADDPSSWTNLNFGDSLTVGTQVLNGDIGSLAASGGTAAVFGYSQSATIATEEMENLHAAGVSDPNLSIVLAGDPNNPIGGILDRFQFPDGIQAFSLTPEPQHLPFLNVPLSIAPTPTDAFPTDIYTGEYDGWADFPQDPTNILGDINALIGIDTVHPFYPDLTSAQLASAIDVGTIGDTNFYDIPENLPILAFMFDGGPAGQFFGDVFSPFLRLSIDWGYGNAGDPAVDGSYLIPLGGGDDMGGPDGSPYEAAQGVAGGPWAETPLGTLYDGSGVAGLFEKMDPLQLLAGFENAGIQTFVGPFTDILADINGGTLSPGDITTMDDVTIFLQNITGYDLVNLVDKSLLDSVTLLGPGAVDALDQALDGPLIPGQPLIDLVGYGFDIFNFFGA